METYRIIDNDRPYRNVLVKEKNRNSAISEGASRLKTCNIRTIKITEPAIERITAETNPAVWAILQAPD